MKLSQLLLQRRHLLRQAYLANLGFAYHRLGGFIARIERAGLHGEVLLRMPDPDVARFEAELTALQGSQSVIEEHFTEEDLVELSEAIEFSANEFYPQLTFRLEDLRERFLRPLERELRESGVTIDACLPPPQTSLQEGFGSGGARESDNTD